MNRKQIISKTAGVIALFLSVIALSGYYGKVYAVTYYVATSGSDSNTGTSASPFATIQNAINAAGSGDAVSVAAGVYNENIIMKTGVSVIGEGPAVTSIVGTARINGVDYTDGVVLFDSVRNAVLKGFRITVSVPVPGVDRGVVFQGATDSTAVIQNCIIINTQYGIIVWNPSGSEPTPTIQNNTLFAINDEQGIYIGNMATAPVIRNNIITGLTGYSLAGIHVIDGTNPPTPVIEYNDVFNIGAGADYLNYPSQTDINGNISLLPRFFDLMNGDFHLINNSPTDRSPCIDAGNPAFQYNDSDGSRNDMGAFGGPCTYLSPRSQQVTAAGGAGFSFDVLTSFPGCSWTANSTSSWILNVIESIPGQTGNGTVTYDVSPNTGPVRQGTITVDGQVFTVFQDGIYNLKLIKSGMGTGTVVSSEATAPLINCGTKCTYEIASYPSDSQVKLKAAADAGSVFGGWLGACSGKGDCDLVMNTNKYVGAVFTVDTLTISTQAGQGGSISPTGKTVNYGETAQFTVTPDDGYHTISVSGCGVTKYVGGVIAAKNKKKNVKSLAAGEVYITGPITESCTISASFAINTFTVIPSAGEHGNINPSTQQTVNYNDTVPFSVKADDGYHIQSVSGCGGAPYTAAVKKKKKKKLTAASEMTYKTGHITESCTVTASFAINTFTVIPKAGAHGSIDPSTPQTANYSDTVSFTVKPDAGYYIESVTGCGIHPSEGGIYITDPVTGDCTVEASFAKETFTVTILKSGTGSGAVTGNGLTCEGNACGGYEAGSKLTLKIKPDDGYRVIDVKINGKSIGPVQTITLKEIMSNFTIEIVFGPA